MKKVLVASLAVLALMGASQAEARGGWGYGGWVAPALIGGVVGYELARPYYAPQPVYVQPPVVYQQAPVYVAPAPTAVAPQYSPTYPGPNGCYPVYDAQGRFAGNMCR
jgi:hypothetical protein